MSWLLEHGDSKPAHERTLLLRSMIWLLLLFTLAGQRLCWRAVWKCTRAEDALGAEVLMVVPGTAFTMLIFSVALMTLVVFG